MIDNKNTIENLTKCKKIYNTQKNTKKRGKISMVNSNISKHALNRMIERNVLCQNKKLNKKQIKRNKQEALQKLKREITKYFAYSIGDGPYEYFSYWYKIFTSFFIDVRSIVKSNYTN